MKNKGKFTQLITFLLITLFLFADLSVYAKKKKKKKTKAKTSKSKTVKNTPTSTPVNSARVSVNTFRKNEGNSSSSNENEASSTTKTEEQKIEDAFEDFKLCMKSVCKDDIEYDRCFDPDKLDDILDDATDCRTKLKKQSDIIQKTIKTKFIQFTSRKLENACTEINGIIGKKDIDTPDGVKKISFKCTVKMIYMAKPISDCKNQEARKSNTTTITVGSKKNLNCTPTDFQMDPDDLQCNKGLSMETKMSLITDSMNAVTNIVQGGLKIAEAKRKRKELKEMDKIEGSGIWQFDGTSLNNACYSVERKYVSSKSELCSSSDEPQWDTNGGYYCEDKNEDNCVMSDNKYGGVSLCSKNKDTPVPCVVELKDATDLKIKEKLSELIRANINKGSGSNNHRQIIKTQLAYSMYKEGLQDASSELDHFQKCETQISYKKKCNNLDSGLCTTTTTTTKGVDSVESDLYTNKGWKDNNNNGIDVLCEKFGRYDGWYCVKQSEEDCKFIDGEWKKPRNVGKNELDKYYNKVDEVDKKFDAMLNIKNDSGFDVDAAKSAYTSNQNYLNSKNKEREDLKSEADKAQQEAINSFTTTGMNAINKGITSYMESTTNKETLTGACYLTDDKGNVVGTPIMQDGMVKKATWSFFKSVN